MGFLRVEDKTFLITGVANKKSIAYSVALNLLEEGAKVVFSVQLPEQQSKVQELFPQCPVFLCDVQHDDQVEALGLLIKKEVGTIHGFLHSLAFANFKDGIRPFIETSWEDFQTATKISLYSLISLSRALAPCFHQEASIVAMSISNTKATSYGYLGPVKAALDSSVSFLAKSFSANSTIRVNAIASGPLKTSASAGIPGYVDNYLFAEKLTLRKSALQTAEVADTVTFLLSPRSSGINGSTLLVDAGMSTNYFDEEVVKKTMGSN